MTMKEYLIWVCEDGTLLEELKKKNCKKLVGVEIDNKKVDESVSKELK